VKKNQISARALEFFNKRTLNFLRPDYAAIPENTCSVWFEQELTTNGDELTGVWLNLIRET